MLRVVLVIIFIAVGSIKIAFAQDKSATQDSISSNYELYDYIKQIPETRYESLLDSIKRGLSDDYFTLRMAFTKTQNWQPYSNNIRDAEKKLRLYLDDQKYDVALALADSILAINYVSIPMHMYCGYIYKKLDNVILSEEHYNHYDKLLASIRDSGEGESPKNGFWVISTKEIYTFLDYYDLQTNSQSLYSADGFSFDLMQVYTEGKADTLNLYFNVSLSIQKLNKQFENK